MGFEQNNFPIKRKLEYSALTPNQVTRISVKDGRGSFGYSFDKDIDVISLMDNLDRPITKLFMTIVNKGYMGYFNCPPASNVQLKDWKSDGVLILERMLLIIGGQNKT